eukprot:4938161-Ditylum_brightwellii.AAC.1
MPISAQLKDHVTYDGSRHSSGKASGTSMNQNVQLPLVTCSSKKNQPNDLSKSCLCSQKQTMPSVKEDQLCTRSMPHSTHRNNIEEQV